MDTLNFFKKELNIENIPDYVKAQQMLKKDKSFFEPNGTIVFCGAQGKGKTLSAVKYVLDVCEKYPECIVVSNIKIPSLKDRLIPFRSVAQFQNINNGTKGVIYLIDEIHILFNSLESKDLDISIFTTIAQQRKQRKHIVGTAQVFARLAKPFREQFKYVILCTHFSFFQLNRVVTPIEDDLQNDEKSNTKLIKVYFFIHSKKLYDAYDTYAVINRGLIDLGGTKRCKKL